METKTFGAEAGALSPKEQDMIKRMDSKQDLDYSDSEIADIVRRAKQDQANKAKQNMDTGEREITEVEQDLIDEELKRKMKLSAKEGDESPIMQLPVGVVKDLEANLEKPESFWIQVNESRYDVKIISISSEKSLIIKADTWKECNGDKNMYNLLVRYRLTRSRIVSIGDIKTKTDITLLDRIEDGIMDHIVDSLYGPSSIDTPETEVMIKNLLPVLMKSMIQLKNGEQ